MYKTVLDLNKTRRSVKFDCILNSKFRDNRSGKRTLFREDAKITHF